MNLIKLKGNLKIFFLGSKGIFFLKFQRHKDENEDLMKVTQGIWSSSSC